MATNVDPLSFLRAVTRDGGFANDRRTIREAQSRARVCRTRVMTMDALFATWRLQIAKVDFARERQGVAANYK